MLLKNIFLNVGQHIVGLSSWLTVLLAMLERDRKAEAKSQNGTSIEVGVCSNSVETLAKIAGVMISHFRLRKRIKRARVSFH